MEVVEEVKDVEREVADVLGALLMAEGSEVKVEDVLSKFEEPFDRLLGEFEMEYTEMGLDEVVVAASTPVVRPLLFLSLPVRSRFFLPKTESPPLLRCFSAPPTLDPLGPPHLTLLHRPPTEAVPETFPHRLVVFCFRARRNGQRSVRGGRTVGGDKETGEGEEYESL